MSLAFSCRGGPVGGLLAVVMVALVMPAFAGDLKERALEDEVQEVILFSDQALLTRTARVRLDKGQHRLGFSALPSACEQDSIRVLVDGARLQGFEVVHGYGEQELPPEIKARRDRIEAIDGEVALLDARKAVLAQEIHFLGNLPPGGPRLGDDAKAPRVDPNTMQKFLDWSAGRLREAGDQIAAFDLERVGLVEEREVLASELLGTTGAGAALSRPRVVALVETDGGTVDLTLVYRTYSARWVPSYDIRLASGNDTMQLGINALVWQQTEEDWHDVRLEMSTAVPSQSAELPELMAWFIEETPPPPPPPPPTYGYESDARSEDMAMERKAKSSKKSSARGRSSAPAPSSVMSAPAESMDYEYGYDEEEDDWIAQDYAPVAEPTPARGDTGGMDSPLALAESLRQQISTRNYLQDQGHGLLNTGGRLNLPLGSGSPFQPAIFGQVVSATPSSDGYESSPNTWTSYTPSSNAMGFDFTFMADGTVSVPSDGQVHKVPLTAKSYTSRIEHVVVAVAEEAAFVRAVIDNGSPYPMLAGMSNIFMDGGYLGRLPTATVAPGQPLELALGRDRAVKVKRTQEQLSDKGGLFGNQKVRVYKISVELENFRDTEVQVRLFDRVAYTYDEDIKVILGERTHEPVTDHGSGMLEWDLIVPAGQKVTLEFEYTLKHNKNYRVWHPSGKGG